MNDDLKAKLLETLANIAAASTTPDELIMNADDAIAMGWTEVPCAFPDCPIYGERHCHIRRPK